MTSNCRTTDLHGRDHARSRARRSNNSISGRRFAPPLMLSVMLRNSDAGICICKTAKSLFATAVTVMGAVPIFFLAIILNHGSVVNGAQVKVFTSRAIATVLDKIGPEFKRTSGHKLNVISGFSPNFVKQIMPVRHSILSQSAAYHRRFDQRRQSHCRHPHQSRTLRTRRGGAHGRTQT